MKRVALLNSVLAIALALGILPLNVMAQQASDEFIEYQSILTDCAYDWEYFTIGSDIYLAVANYLVGSTHIVDSKIYRWNGASFVEFQSILTVGAKDWEHFTIGGDTYLALANYHNDVTNNIDSKIYRWDGSSFVEFQSIPTNGAMHWESFTIGGDTYLAVANRWDDVTYSIDSTIYRWNGASFVEFQSIPAHGAVDWESFTIDGDTYLAVANHRDNSTFHIDSKVYRWDGVGFVEFQSIPTLGAHDWESFTIGSDTYLAVANHRDDSAYTVDSKLYRWNGSSFVEFQSVPTIGAHDWKSFTVGSDVYLAVANNFDGSTYSVDSEIYQWNGSSFVEFQSIPTTGATDWEYFAIDSDAYMVVANARDDVTHNVESRLYRWEGALTQFIVTPVSQEAYPGDTVTVDLGIQGVSDLYAAQAECSVNPAVLELQSAVFGDFFDPVNRLVAAHEVSPTLGTWFGAISQQNPAGPLSGDGLYATLTLEATGVGTTTITCDPLFSDRDGFTQTVSFIPATVTVLPYATITGTATYQGRLAHAGIEVVATGPVTRTAWTDAGGGFVLDELRAGDYSVRADAGSYLPTCITTTLAAGDTVALATTELLGGDLNDDEVINIGDATLLTANFNETVPPADARADINADGVVNVQDLAILAGNYEVSGCQGW